LSGPCVAWASMLVPYLNPNLLITNTYERAVNFKLCVQFKCMFRAVPNIDTPGVLLAATMS